MIGYLCPDGWFPGPGVPFPGYPGTAEKGRERSVMATVSWRFALFSPEGVIRHI